MSMIKLTGEESNFEAIAKGILRGFAKDSTEWGTGNNPEFAIKKYREMIQNGNGVFFLSVDGDRIQGGIGGIKGPDFHDGVLYAIETFWFVYPEYRQAGVGAELLNTFEEWGRSNGCKKVAMIHLVDSYPEVLKRFYESSGYHLAELHYVKDL